MKRTQLSLAIAAALALSGCGSCAGGDDPSNPSAPPPSPPRPMISARQTRAPLLGLTHIDGAAPAAPPPAPSGAEGGP